MSRRRLAVVVPVAALVATLASCGDEAGGSGGVEDRTLTVLAAASLTESLTQVADHFEAEHVGVRVQLAFGSSATLAQQVVEGAPADVLVTADERSMDAAEDGNAIADGPYPFASNALVLVTPADDPAGIEAITDLQRDATFVTCVPTAPCGDVAAQVLASHDVTAAPASQEVDVKAVLAKVVSGEADAGLVYASDAVAAGDAVRVVDVPGIDLVRTNYYVAALHEAEQLDLGMEFVAALRGDRARLLLQDAGFHGVVVE